MFIFLVTPVLAMPQAEIRESSTGSITQQDLEIAIGEWTGTITYLDYQTHVPFSMPVELTVKKAGKINQLNLQQRYTNEPKANSTEKIVVRRNGTMINKGLITNKDTDNAGTLHIITEQRGTDDHRAATIRYIFTMGAEILRIRKEVRFDNTEEWIKRSEYNYTRSVD